MGGLERTGHLRSGRWDGVFGGRSFFFFFSDEAGGISIQLVGDIHGLHLLFALFFILLLVMLATSVSHRGGGHF